MEALHRASVVHPAMHEFFFFALDLLGDAGEFHAQGDQHERDQQHDREQNVALLVPAAWPALIGSLIHNGYISSYCCGVRNWMSCLLLVRTSSMVTEVFWMETTR